MKQPQFINTPNSQIIPRRMKRQSNKRFIIIKLLLDLKIKHPQQLTIIIFIIPYPNSTIQLTTCRNQRSLLTYIHTCYWIVMETFVKILEDYLFVS